MLRNFWQKIFKKEWIFGLTLILLFGCIRFYLVLQANITGNYGIVSILFLLMWVAPFILLTRNGRKEIGIVKPHRYTGLIFCFISGAVVCILSYYVAIWLYGHSIANWYQYISRTYTKSGMVLNGQNRHLYFFIYAVIGITITPVGEELLYRGIIHESFARESGHNRASLIDSLAFSITHLAHFGIVYDAGTWKFLVFPAIIWMLVMFAAGRIFFICKERTGSISGAIICHAGFNLAMLYFIFYHLL